jgi:hypothetical protein
MCMQTDNSATRANVGCRLHNGTIKAAELILRATTREGDNCGVWTGLGKEAVVFYFKVLPCNLPTGKKFTEQFVQMQNIKLLLKFTFSTRLSQTTR